MLQSMYAPPRILAFFQAIASCDGSDGGEFSPIVIASSVTLLHHGTQPKPVPATFDGLISGQFDSRLVTIHGAVVQRTWWWRHGAPCAQRSPPVVTEGGRFQVYLDSVDENALKICWTPKWRSRALPRKVRRQDAADRGRALRFLIGKHQGSQARRHQPMDPPGHSMDRILAGYHVNDLSSRSGCMESSPITSPTHHCGYRTAPRACGLKPFPRTIADRR